MDLLGFARSTRVIFPSDPVGTESTYVESFEFWRKALGLEKFILIGHSFGGYLAAAYTLKFPSRIEHLFLVDPWGFTEPKNVKIESFFVKHVVRKLPFPSPLGIMRASGWLGPHLLRRVRQDFIGVFHQEPILYIDREVEIPPDSEQEQPTPVMEIKQTNPVSVDSEHFDTNVVYDYIYHCNAREPTGEKAFGNLSTEKVWAAMPMLTRLPSIPKEIPITFVYGGRSWLDMSTGIKAKGLRQGSYVDVKVIASGGHSAYAQCSDEFNNFVNTVCSQIDGGSTFNEPNTVSNTTKKSSTSTPRRKPDDSSNCSQNT
ncbi:Alpha/beta hydrolase domain-containing protein 4 [Cichlidogyrus casuarinus]|uniref:Alpha/beta hydrolase domain-containing protein 4 n=1 Tax=Cichlidogyrus casuarinus TaxID=1844966 RepID=A0ABD2QLZ3_9PLAT